MINTYFKSRLTDRYYVKPKNVAYAINNIKSKMPYSRHKTFITYDFHVKPEYYKNNNEFYVIAPVRKKNEIELVCNYWKVISEKEYLNNMEVK